MNIGFMYEKRMKCDYFIYHDIDTIRLWLLIWRLTSNFVSTYPTFKSMVFDEYFGGVKLL